MLLEAPHITLGPGASLSVLDGAGSYENAGVVKIFAGNTAELQAQDLPIEAAAVFWNELPYDWRYAEDFPAADHGWTFTAPPEHLPGLVPNDESGDPGRLSIARREQGGGLFGQWYSPRLQPSDQPTSHAFYLARFVVESDQADALLTPGFRLRAATADGEINPGLHVEGTAGGEALPTAGNPKTYDLLWQMADTPEGLHLAFDMIDFDAATPSSATVSLEYVELIRFREDVVPERTHLRTENLRGLYHGWTSYVYSQVFDAPFLATSPSGAGLVMTAAAGRNNLFGHWSSPNNIPLSPDQVLEIELDLRSSLPAERRHESPPLRLRFNEEGFRLATQVHLASAAGGAPFPDADTPKTLTLHHLPSGLADRGFFSLDLMHFGTGDDTSATFTLEEMRVYVREQWWE